MENERVKDEKCELCRAQKITEWYFEDETCWIADCEICETPIVVWQWHGAAPPQAEQDYMLEQLSKIATERFGERFLIDGQMRQIPDHFHAHARKLAPWR